MGCDERGHTSRKILELFMIAILISVKRCCSLRRNETWGRHMQTEHSAVATDRVSHPARVSTAKCLQCPIGTFSGFPWELARLRIGKCVCIALEKKLLEQEHLIIFGTRENELSARQFQILLRWSYLCTISSPTMLRAVNIDLEGGQSFVNGQESGYARLSLQSIGSNDCIPTHWLNQRSMNQVLL